MSVWQGFDGINNTGVLSIECRADGKQCDPPDPQVATGPNYVMEMVNLAGAIYTKQGVMVRFFSLRSFFNVTNGDHLSDPKVLYDLQSGRWFASLLDTDGPFIYLAVSSSSDPTGTWKDYTLRVPNGDPADQPTIGVSDDKFVVSANLFNDTGFNGYDGAAFWVINKGDMVNGASALRFQVFGPGTLRNYVSIHPAQSQSATTTEYMVSTGGMVAFTSRNSSSWVYLFSITGVPPSAGYTVKSISIKQVISPSPRPGQPLFAFARQPGTSANVSISDYRVQDAVWSQGRLWYGVDTLCTPSGDTVTRSCIRLTQIDTGSSTIRQDYNLSARGTYFFYPGLSVDGMGSLDVIFGYSNSTTYPSLGVTGQAVNDPLGSLVSPQTIRAGTSFDNSTRYGDYFGAAVDPSDQTVVWLAGQYVNRTLGYCHVILVADCWDTAIAKTRVLTTVSINSTSTFLGVSVLTTSTVTVDPPFSQLTLSGSASVKATNATTGALLFSKTYTISNVPITGQPPNYRAVFILNIAVNSCTQYQNPCPLSSNNQISYPGTSASSLVQVTRNVDINHDGVVNTADANVITAAYHCTVGQQCYNPQADLNTDGVVDAGDLGIWALYNGAQDYI